MKKTLMILSLVFLSALLSCQKDNEPLPLNCYECSTLSMGTHLDDFRVFCNITSEDARMIEKEGTYTRTFNEPVGITRYTYVTTCVLKK
jgi:hypothetical protein